MTTAVKIPAAPEVYFSAPILRITKVVAEAHHQSDDTAGIPVDLLQLLLAVGFLRHVFQRGIATVSSCTMMEALI